MAKINIYGRLHNNTDESVVTGADEVFDDTLQKKQSDINQDLKTADSNATTALDAAKNELNDKIKANTDGINALSPAPATISHVYAGFTAMNNDTNPQSDITKTALKKGEFVIVNSSDGYNNNVYRYNGADSDQKWTLIYKVDARFALKENTLTYEDLGETSAIPVSASDTTNSQDSGNKVLNVRTSGRKVQLKDKDGNEAYPRTKAKCVVMSNNRAVEELNPDNLSTDTDTGEEYAYVVMDLKNNPAFIITKSGEVRYKDKYSATRLLSDLNEALPEKIQAALENVGISSDGKAFFIIDNNRNLVWYADKDGVHLGKTVFHSQDGTMAFVDDKGNAVLYFDKDGVHLGKTVFHSQDGTMAFVDDKGNAVLYFDKDGVHLGKMVAHGKELVFVDSNGYIGAKLGSNGELICVPEKSSYIKAFNKYKDELDLPQPSGQGEKDYDVDLPVNIFQVLNDCSSESITGLQRIYAPRIYIDRLLSNEKPNVLFGNGTNRMLFTFSQYKSSDRVTDYSNIYITPYQFKLRGYGYKEKTVSLNVRTTKNSVLLDKTINFFALGDSLTDQGEWQSYMRKLALMDGIDYMKYHNENKRRIDIRLLGIMHDTNNEDFTYRDERISVRNYNEGRSSWATTSYLRHAKNYTWARVTYNGTSRSILYCAWRELGLFDKYSREFANNAADKLLISRTCNGQYPITINAIDGFVWENNKRRISLWNVSFENATDTQKQLLVDCLSGKGENNLFDNPENPFFDINTVNKTKDTDNCYAMSWETYYSRYKTHDESGNQLETLGTYANINYMYLCKPNFIGINLGTNDSAQISDVTETANNVWQIAEILKQATGAQIMLFEGASPQSMFPEWAAVENEGARNVNLGDSYRNRNIAVKNKCGNLDTQAKNGVYYCPAYYVQGFGHMFNLKLTEIGTEQQIGKLLIEGDVHPDRISYDEWGYQMYALLCHILESTK